MKILFVGAEDQKWGSTRLHVHNLAYWLKQLGHEVTVNGEVNLDYDWIIAGKEIKAPVIKDLKQTNPRALIGKVNPSDANDDELEAMRLSDFFVVGCIPERDYYLKHNANILIIPQIERIFEQRKQHSHTDPVVIGYHGNLHHLEQFNTALSPALEKLAQEIPIKLVAIYDRASLGDWTVGRPQVEVELVQWELDTLEVELLKCDIGIVPGLYPIAPFWHKTVLKMLDMFTRTQDGLSTDYLTRYKNTTNSGRAFVFHQLGIPVVSDFLPTSFHILGSPQNGLMAHSTEGWYYALKSLAESVTLRQTMADNAYAEFQRLYDPLSWVEMEFSKLKAITPKTQASL